LVEQNAAAAKALEEQSQGMKERVSFFRVDDEPTADAAPPPVVAFKRPAAETARPQQAVSATRQGARLVR
jgi:hypothetical protein